MILHNWKWAVSIFFPILSTEWMDRFLSFASIPSQALSSALACPLHCQSFPMSFFNQALLVGWFLGILTVVALAIYLGLSLSTVRHVISATASLVPIDFLLSWAWPPTPQSKLTSLQILVRSLQGVITWHFFSSGAAHCLLPSDSHYSLVEPVVSPWVDQRKWEICLQKPTPPFLSWERTCEIWLCKYTCLSLSRSDLSVSSSQLVIVNFFLSLRFYNTFASINTS